MARTSGVSRGCEKGHEVYVQGEDAIIKANGAEVRPLNAALTNRPGVSRRWLMRVYSHTPLSVCNKTCISAHAALDERPATLAYPPSNWRCAA